MNVTLEWGLPSTRTSGKPLTAADIAHVMVEVSANGGESWAPVGLFPPEVLNTRVTDLDFGTWLFRGLVVPKVGLPSAPMTATVVNEDTSPPEALVFLTATPV